MTDILNILQLALGDIALSSHNSAFPSSIRSGVSTLKKGHSEDASGDWCP